MTLTTRPLGPSDTSVTSALHRDVLSMEFLARCGVGFLRRYHRAWIDSPDALALAAVEEDGTVVGVLLGSLDPAAHYRTMVRRHGVTLASWLAIGALTHPRAARELLSTRLLRYLRGLTAMVTGAGRALLGRLPRERRTAGSEGTAGSQGTAGSEGTAGDAGAGAPGTAEESAPAAPEPDGRTKKVGEVTHVMVRSDVQSRGAGRALLEEARRRGEAAGLAELVLVTPPDLDARHFYEHLGWEMAGELTSRSGEPFLRYRLVLSR